MSSSLTPLDRSTIRRGLDAFAARWRTKLDSLSPGELGRTEKAHAQTFWSDLLRQFGVIPEQFSLFEHEAVRATTGNRGYIDVFRSNLFIGEAKSVGKDLLSDTQRDGLLVLHELIHVVHVGALLPLLAAEPELEHGDRRLSDRLLALWCDGRPPMAQQGRVLGR